MNVGEIYEKKKSGLSEELELGKTNTANTCAFPLTASRVGWNHWDSLHPMTLGTEGHIQNVLIHTLKNI